MGLFSSKSSESRSLSSVSDSLPSFGSSESHSLNSVSNSSKSGGGDESENTYNTFQHVVLKDRPSEKSLEFNYGYQTVLEKLEKFIKDHPEKEGEINSRFGNIKDFAIILSDRERFKNCFFGAYSKTMIASETEKLLENLKEDFTSEEMAHFKKNMQNTIKAMNDQKLEFRLSPLKYTNTYVIGAILKFGSIIINKSGFTNWNYGAFHSFLSLNGLILEWNASSLVIPSLDLEKMVYFSYEIKDGFLWRIFKTIKNGLINIVNFITSFITYSWHIRDIVEKELDIICQVCVAFNTNRFYDAASNNCQFFVDSILKEIGAELKFEGEMKREIDYFKKYGELDFTFREHKFDTRKQLDEYAKLHFYTLKNDEKKLLFLFKNTFEARRMAKIDKKTGKFENDTDEKELGTTKEAEEMWKKFEINDKMGEGFWSFL